MASLTGIVWQGKCICPEQATMFNRVFGKEMIPTDIYIGTSFLDGGEALIFDYSRTGVKFARRGRDEVRQVGPGLFLGALYIVPECGCPKLANYFLLEAECGCTCGP